MDAAGNVFIADSGNGDSEIMKCSYDRTCKPILAMLVFSVRGCMCVMCMCKESICTVSGKVMISCSYWSRFRCGFCLRISIIQQHARSGTQ